ncbi:MAG: aminopeptidase P N-terminal domain-containing protein, partial [Thermodesulfobacteriota bacterium]|nr:aminopeptidase P N-terminal domain-containing protein [Thermodesulfobacteriota bacterium]
MTKYAEQFNKEVFLKENQPLAEVLRLETSLREARRVLWEWVDHTQFRQYSDYYYLSGINEPSSAFLLMPEGEHKF